MGGGKIASDLGFEAKGGVFVRLIERGTAVPASHDENFTTALDNQPTIEIKVFRGVTDRVADAQRIGVYTLTVPKPGPKGVPLLAVTFSIDASGGFQLTAIDSASGTPVTVSTAG